MCKECVSAYNRLWRKENSEKINENNRAYRERHRERVKEGKRRYYEKNRERILERRRELEAERALVEPLDDDDYSDLVPMEAGGFVRWAVLTTERRKELGETSPFNGRSIGVETEWN